jgi:hypothetical protein
MQVQTINYFLGRPNLNVFKRFNQLNSFTQVGMFVTMPLNPDFPDK